MQKGANTLLFAFIVLVFDNGTQTSLFVPAVVAGIFKEVIAICGGSGQ